MTTTKEKPASTAGETWSYEPTLLGYAVYADMGSGPVKVKTYSLEKDAEKHVNRALNFAAERAANKALFEQVQNPADWKLPTKPKREGTEAKAKALADAISFFQGGAEIKPGSGGGNKGFIVTGKGYYYYCPED